MKTTSHHSSPFPIIKKSKVLDAGFTLLEMVIVLGIIAMIMGGAIFVMKNISDSGAITVVDGDFASIDNALQAYRNNAGKFPFRSARFDGIGRKTKFFTSTTQVDSNYGSAAEGSMG